MLSDIHNLPSIKETIWCTQKAMAVLFDVGIPAISKHLTNVFETGELSEEATISKMETVVKRVISIPHFLLRAWKLWTQLRSYTASQRHKVFRCVGVK